MSLSQQLKNIFRTNTARFLLSASLLLGVASLAKAEEPNRTMQNEKLPDSGSNFSASLGFGYRTMKVGNELEDYLDITRNNFEGSMPGFSKLLQVGDQLPYLSVQLGFVPGWRLFNEDTFEFIAKLDSSSSLLFGETKDKATYDATLSAIDFGPTDAFWTQHLNFYGSAALGASYSPVSWGESISISPSISIFGGISYLSSKSVLEIKVLTDTQDVENVGGWEVLNQFNVYKNIRTDAACSGLGWLVVGGVGIKAEYDSFLAELSAGYRVEIIPEFKIHEDTMQDGKKSRKNTAVEYDASGLDAILRLGFSW